MIVIRKRVKTEVRKRQIIDAAGSLIFKYGSEHLTVKRIAAQVGISDAAIYRHFRSKKSILSFLLSHVEETLLGDISPEIFNKKALTLKILEKAFLNRLAKIEKHMGISFQVIAEIVSLGDRKLNKQAYEIINTYTARLREILNEAMAVGAIREDIDLEASAIILFTMIQGMVNTWAISNGGIDLQKQFKSLWIIYCQAITRR
jgi:AcrR family transcriptional regulator